MYGVAPIHGATTQIVRMMICATMDMDLQGVNSKRVNVVCTVDAMLKLKLISLMTARVALQPQPIAHNAMVVPSLLRARVIVANLSVRTNCTLFV